MKKKIIIACLVCAAALCGCSGGQKEETAAAKPAESAAAESAAADTAQTEASTLPAEVEKLREEMENLDSSYIAEKGVLVVGVTDFEPMDYRDETGAWVGFDADLAKAFADDLQVEVEFVEIDWDNKIMELDGQTIDCVWNGMTLTDEVTSAMECSGAYLNNAQVVVVNKDLAASIQSADDLKGLSIAAEAGSAGEAESQALGLSVTPVKAQSDAIMEVAAGTSDAAVIDSLMAAAMVGEGTGYEDLTYTIALNSEEYGVGFRKGSDMAEILDQFLTRARNEGLMDELAEKYGVQAALIK